MSNIPFGHIIITVAGFVAGYAMTQVAQGYDTVAFHWSWQAILMGLSASGLYVGGLVQTSPTKP